MSSTKKPPLELSGGLVNMCASYKRHKRCKNYGGPEEDAGPTFHLFKLFNVGRTGITRTASKNKPISIELASDTPKAAIESHAHVLPLIADYKLS